MNILMIPKKYILADGSIYWHKVYFDTMPKCLTDNNPPFGSFNYAYYLYQPHKYLIELVDGVKYFIQRGCRGYSDRDVWGWFYHHSQMMVGVLKYLRENKHGYPIGLTPSKWSRILKVMEVGFQATVEEENDYTSHQTLSQADYRKLIFKRHRKLMLGLKYFRKYYYSLWD